MAVTRVAGSGNYSSSTGFGGGFSSTTSAGATSKSFTYTPNGSGNLVLIWVTMTPNPTSPTTVSLAATGWAFTQIGGIVNGGTSGGCGAMFWALSPNTSQATFTMTWNQGTNVWFNALIDEFSGMDSATPTAGNNGATGTGTPTVSVTPTASNCMIWVPCNDSVTAVGAIGGSAATQGANDTQQDWSEYRLLSGGSGVAQSCTIGGSGSYIIGAVAIQPAGAAAANWKKENYWWQRATDSSGAF